MFDKEGWFVYFRIQIMKKLYYFTHKNLRFTEIKGLKTKFVFLISLSLLIISFLGFYLINEFSQVKTLPTNPAFQNKIGSLLKNYQKVSEQLDSLLKVNNELRIAANLPAISNEEAKLGVGGGEFNLSIDFLNSSESNSLKEADYFVDKLLRKIEFEKKNIDDISLALTKNEELFKDIPAIKPCNGSLSAHGFGMRFHPILHVNRMHNGIDIITNVGTPVYASGGGVIDFVGNKNGFGLCVEIDHGFGYRTIYGHLSGTKAKQGQKVDRNTLIAFTGNSGLSAGPHLHYEVLHDGINLDPEQFFFDDSRLFANN
jgi:murein DD-endopeptidase MepM/ murein hydrolase activator NlpD